MSNTHPFTISDAAVDHIKAQLAQTQSRFLRLGVKESGCNGYMYTLDYLEQPGEADLSFDIAPDINVCVAEIDMQMISGTEIDILTQGLNRAMIFKNPKATSYCGCGESFAVAGQADDDSSADGTDTAGIDALATDVGPNSRN